MTTMLEQSLDQLGVADRAEYRELVFAAVENPDFEPDRARLREILRAVERTPEQLLADITKVRQLYEAAQRLAVAEQAAVKVPELKTARREAEQRLAELQIECARKIDAALKEVNRLADEASLLETEVMSCRQQATTDWRSVDFFPSNDPPARIKLNQQQPSTGLAAVGCMANTIKTTRVHPSRSH